jgi:tetratricopeptide (TPR) repeat protein
VLPPAGFPDLGEKGPTLAQLRQAIIDNPQDPEANYKLGLRYEELGRPREALKYLQEAVKLRPDYADALHELQKLREGSGEYGEAAKYLEKLSKLKPDSLEIKNQLSNDNNKQGLALLQQGKFADAAGAFQEAAQSSPKSPGPLNNLGIAQLQAGNRQEAVEAFQGAIRRDPKSVVEAHYNLSLTYLDMGDKWRARVEFLSVRSLDPDMARELGPLVLPGTPQAPEAPPAPPFLPKSTPPMGEE